ncbi:hypothetical protein BH11ACT8_BH11ACT8_08450 [soil metagenome]
MPLDRERRAAGSMPGRGQKCGASHRNPGCCNDSIAISTSQYVDLVSRGTSTEPLFRSLRGLAINGRCRLEHILEDVKAALAAYLLEIAHRTTIRSDPSASVVDAVDAIRQGIARLTSKAHLTVGGCIAAVLHLEGLRLPAAQEARRCLGLGRIRTGRRVGGRRGRRAGCGLGAGLERRLGSVVRAGGKSAEEQDRRGGGQESAHRVEPSEKRCRHRKYRLTADRAAPISRPVEECRMSHT